MNTYEMSYDVLRLRACTRMKCPLFLYLDPQQCIHSAFKNKCVRSRDVYFWNPIVRRSQVANILLTHPVEHVIVASWWFDHPKV
jgi:hypothetical protein